MDFSKENIKAKIKSGTEEFKYLVKNTSIEIALFAVLGAGIGSYYQTNNELRRAEKIPLAFSEIGQIKRDAAKQGREIGPIAEYSMALNDMCMKIFEAYNEAQRPFIPGKNTELFARHIYDARDLNNIYRYNLQDLVDTIPGYIPATNAKLASYQAAAIRLTQANESMRNSRDEDHNDQYRTEIKTRTTYDKDGNANGTETYTEQVYDHTIHTYDYNKKHGETGAKQLNALFEYTPALQLQESITTTSQTNADGEYAAEKSRSENSISAKKISAEDLLSIANTRYNGSTIINNTNHIQKQYPLLNNSRTERNSAKKTAQSDRYTTYSHSDAGPKEFQIAENTYQLGKDIETSINQMLNAIQLTQDQIPVLHAKLQEFIDKGYVHYASGKPEAKKLEKEIMTITKEIYKANFKEGVNVDRFRLGMVFLAGLIGLIVGGGVGAGIDQLGQKTKLYEKIFSKKQ